MVPRKLSGGYEEEGNRNICGYLQVVPDNLKSFLKRKAYFGDCHPPIFFKGGFMCGIFGYIGQSQNDFSLVFNGLKELEYRGYDSWGVVSKTSNGLVTRKFLGKINQAPLDLPPSSVSLGHTRWATHGGITLANCHPHLDCDGQIAVVHNGIVENYLELKKKSLSLGHVFSSETDSEVIVHLIEGLRRHHSLVSSVRLAFNQLQGLNAVAIVSRQDQQLVVAKNGSPLVIGLGHLVNFVASDPTALFAHTHRFLFLEDDEMAVLTANQVKLYDVKTAKAKKYSPRTINPTNFDDTLSGYSYYLEKEINEQPSVIDAINSHIDLTAIQNIYRLIKKSDRVFFTGCGSSYFAALFCSHLLSFKLKKPIICLPASEFGFYLHSFTEKSLLISFSQSGETTDVISLVNQAKAGGVATAALVNMPFSTLHRLVNHCQLLPCGPERCVLATKSFTAQISLFLKIIGEDLAPAANAVRRILKPASLKRIARLASLLTKSPHIYLIGRGLSLPIASESALKIKEVSYLHAEAFAGGELKHGAIALIESGTPCLVFAPSDDTFSDIISNATEIKARGGYIIGLSSTPHPVFDYHLTIPDCGVGTVLPQLVAAQLLAYHLCLNRGLDPDKPRNLAKSVTVK